jgi:SAM-dependent methyltransferase
MCRIEEASAGTACPVCAATSASTLYPTAPDPITGQTFSIQICAACGVAFTAPRPADLEPYYPPRYRGYGPFVTAVLQALYARRVRKWARHDSAQGRSILEIGCGPGLMLEVFQRAGWSVLGLERNTAAAAQAARLGVPVRSCDVAELPDIPAFDLIVMFNVLEHLAHPVQVLAACARRLKPGGELIVNVPNLASWQARFGGPVWLHLDPPRHLVHFSYATLREAFERAGLRAAGVSFVSFEHDPYGWSESAINRIMGRSNVLTRYLMGFDRFGAATTLAAGLFALLALPAALLSVASWLAGCGALMEVTGRRVQDTRS